MGDRRRSGATEVRQRRKAGISLVILALLVTACGGDDAGDDAGDDTASDSNGEAPESDEDITLSVWIHRDSYVPPDQFASFEEEYPNITVDWQVVPDDDLLQQLLVRQEAGEPMPDVIHFDGPFRGAMYESGLVREIDDLVDRWEEEDPDLFAELYDSVWEQGRWDGKQVGMAATGDADFIYYRADWLNELGLEEPDSWEGILDAARAIKEDRPDTFPFGMYAGRGNGVNYLLSHMAAVGMEYSDAGIPQLDSDAGRHIVDFYSAMSAEELVSPEAVNWDTDDSYGQIIAGNAAMATGDAGVAQDLDEAGLTTFEQWDVMPAPLSISGGGTDGVFTAIERNWHITSASEHPYEASLVFRYVMEAEHALATTLQGGDPARTRAVLENEEFTEAPGLEAFEDEEFTVFAEAEPGPVVLEFNELVGVLELMMQDILQNPDQATDDVIATWQTELDAIGS